MLRILLLGSGAVGLSIAAALHAGGMPPDIIARGRTKEALEQNGLVRKGIFPPVHVSADQLRLYADLAQLPAAAVYDVVLVSTKTTQTESVLIELSRQPHLVSENTKIVLIQNGLDDEAMHQKYFSKDPLVSARIFTGFIRPEPHISEVTVHSSTFLMGSIYGCDVSCLIPLASAINQGGIPCEVAEHITKNIWAKLLYNCALNPLSAVLGVAYGRLLESPYTREIMSGVIDEIFAVMAASGNVTFWAQSDLYKKRFFEHLVPDTAQHRSSMLQDIERGQKTEIDVLTGAIVRLGITHHIPTPNNCVLLGLIKAKESL